MGRNGGHVDRDLHVDALIAALAMETGSILIGITQIAIALAGFTTIASVVVQISDSTSPNLLAVRLKLTLTFSMYLIVMTILPIVFAQVSDNQDLWWRRSAIGALIAGAFVAAYAVGDQLMRVLRDPKNAWWQTIATATFGFASLGASGAAVLREAPAFWYFLAIALALAMTLTMVIGLILSFPVFDVHRKPRRPPDAD